MRKAFKNRYVGVSVSGNQLPIVLISPKERAAQELLPKTRAAAHNAFREHGCVLLRGCFEVHFLRKLAKAWHKNNPQDSAMMAKVAYKGDLTSEIPLRPVTISQRSPNRFEITLPMTGPFGDPTLVANPLVLSILKMSLTDQLQLSSLTGVVSFPGAAFQRIHRDYPLIYGSTLLQTVNSHDLPPYAISVSIPLVDVDLSMGPTEVWLGSHLWPGDYLPRFRHEAVKANLEMGDCMMFDFRLVHAGGPNRSSRVRPIIFASYARPWFHDDVGNHPVDNPVDLPLDKWLAFDKPTQKLTMRAYTQAIRAMK